MSRGALPAPVLYLCTALDDKDRAIDGEVIERYRFECYKDLLPIASQSIGLSLLCHLIEHLTLDSNLTVEQRWPSSLHTGANCYRRRPNVIPIIAGKDQSVFS